MLERRKPSTSYRGSLPSRKPFSHSSDNSGPLCRRNWSKDKDGSVVDKSSPAQDWLSYTGLLPAFRTKPHASSLKMDPPCLFLFPIWPHWL